MLFTEEFPLLITAGCFERVTSQIGRGYVNGVTAVIHCLFPCGKCASSENIVTCALSQITLCESTSMSIELSPIVFTLLSL